MIFIVGIVSLDSEFVIILIGVENVISIVVIDEMMIFSGMLMSVLILIFVLI